MNKKILYTIIGILAIGSMVPILASNTIVGDTSVSTSTVNTVDEVASNSISTKDLTVTGTCTGCGGGSSQTVDQQLKIFSIHFNTTNPITTSHLITSNETDTFLTHIYKVTLNQDEAGDTQLPTVMDSLADGQIKIDTPDFCQGIYALDSSPDKSTWDTGTGGAAIFSSDPTYHWRQNFRVGDNPSSSQPTFYLAIKQGLETGGCSGTTFMKEGRLDYYIWMPTNSTIVDLGSP